MKLKLKADYLVTLREWRQDVENDIRRPCSWREIFEPDNTVTFADLRPGQAYVPRKNDRGTLTIQYGVVMETLHKDGFINTIEVRRDGKGYHNYWRPTAEVTPGKIIDGKFVPDEEGE